MKPFNRTKYELMEKRANILVAETERLLKIQNAELQVRKVRPYELRGKEVAFIKRK